MSFNQKYSKENKHSSDESVSWIDASSSLKNDDTFDSRGLFWAGIETPFEKTKENLWEQLEAKIDFDAKEKKPKIEKLTWFRYSAAAIFVLLLCTTFFARFYTTNVNSNFAEVVSHTLPDGSTVKLNAGSELAYNPYWWSLSRKTTLTGEAFFEVEKGSNFKVISNLGTTEVLGTSFNILARNNQYEVFCKTGLVKVYLKNSLQQVFLNPNEKTFTNGNQLVLEKEQSLKSHAAWMFNSFDFNKKSLAFVLDEVARRYDVKIDYNFTEKNIYRYTGYFEKSENAENTLEVICLSLGLEYKKISENSYRIKKMNE